MKVLIVSNHVLIGQSLVSMLQNLPTDDRVEAGLCDASEVVRRARDWPADLILVDAITDFVGSISIIQDTKETLPEARIVVLGMQGDDASVYEAINAGASGYLTHETSASTLVATLRGMMRGELGLSRVASMRVVQQLRQAARARPARMPIDMQGKLTQREQEVFDLVRRGMRSREIAERLYIAEATVYKHIQNVLDKLQVHSRAQAVIVAETESAPESLRSRPVRRAPHPSRPA